MFGNNEKKALKVLLKFLFYRILLKLFDFLKKKSTNKQKIKFKIKITIAASVAGPIKKNKLHNKSKSALHLFG